ncbi:hypothetical protein [Actinoallomurus sp. CA-150999]|uniref:hypothetical protein n=1 Tax=Actinoallomurus sp. CA-150999 TaxID=3239887 RepID=UPI003D93AB40
MEHLIESELPDADAAAAAAIVETGYERQTPLRRHFANSRRGSKGYAIRIASIALSVLSSCENTSLSDAVERAVGYACGPEVAHWEYVCINLTSEASEPIDLGGWQLANFDYANDPTLPVKGAPGVAGDPYSPRTCHGAGHGALRRLLSSRPVPVDDDGPRVLVWPLLALNLALDSPVIAGAYYRVEQGRRVIRENSPWPSPSEVSRWGYSIKPFESSTYGPFSISSADLPNLSLFCRTFQGIVDLLDERRRGQLARAADHFLFVKCHVLGGLKGEAQVSTLHASEAAFRLTAALECLLAGGDGGRTDLSRKVQQRAAVLVGEDDDDRLRVRDVVGNGYSARSAYAHGDKDRESDLVALRSVARRVMTNWAAQAAHCARQTGRLSGGNGLANVLDDALLSHDLYREHVIEPRDRFQRDAGLAKPIQPQRRIGTWSRCEPDVSGLFILD